MACGERMRRARGTSLPQARASSLFPPVLSLITGNDLPVNLAFHNPRVFRSSYWNSSRFRHKRGWRRPILPVFSLLAGVRPATVSGSDPWSQGHSRAISATPFLPKLPQHLRQRLGQVLGDEAEAERAAAGAVQPDGGGGRLERRDALRREAGDEAGQDVAGAGGGERRGQVPADRGAAVGRSHDRIGALEHDDRAREPGRRPGACELVVPGVDAPGGVMTTAWPPRSISAANCRASPAKLVSASASSTIVRPFAGRVSAAAMSLRRSGPTPAPGPSAIARRRSSASSASKPWAPE